MTIENPAPSTVNLIMQYNDHVNKPAMRHGKASEPKFTGFSLGNRKFRLTSPGTLRCTSALTLPGSGQDSNMGDI